MCLRKKLVIYYIISPENVPDRLKTVHETELPFFLRPTFNAQVLMLDTAFAITFHCKANHNNMQNYYQKNQSFSK